MLRLILHHSTRFVTILIVLWFVLGVAPIVEAQNSTVVINEIHYDPDVRTELVEFVELYNPTANSVSLQGWTLSGAIEYTFGTITIPPAGYIVVTENIDSLKQKFIFASQVYGPFIGRLNNEGETLMLRNAAGDKIDEVTYQLGFPWPTVGDPVPEDQPGQGYSIQLINADLDNDLAGSWRSAYPTPSLHNTSVYTSNSFPHIRQVKHQPKQPRSGDGVTITAKVTDADGVESVTLYYQVVEPGNYIPATLPNYPSMDPETTPNQDYEQGWVSMDMKDDGQEDDPTAGDDMYSVAMPTTLQQHRRLIRYRIQITDTQGNTLTVPYEDDPQQNFAYFVYNGVPAWRGALQPGSADPAKAEVVTYSHELLESLPIYHLLSRAVDIRNFHRRSYDNTAYYFSGTLVYDGEVYDNIHYRVRGQASTFRTGKEKWKFNFNRGHYFQARKDNGEKYAGRWDKMNVASGTCPWWASVHPAPNRGYWDAGTRGMMMNEALAFRFYRMAGVPCSHTNYFHFRIIDDEQEADPTNQYEGDFWGLYLAIEHPDGAFLDEHGLPDGNVYRMDGGANQTHQGRTLPDDYSDLYGLGTNNPTLDWWAQTINLTHYYSSRGVGIAINDSDRRPNSNTIYYHNAETDQWWMLPWDLDLTFEWSTHYDHWEDFEYALIYPEYEIASKNRARELLDLLFNDDQAAQVIDEIAAIISTSYDGHTFVQANQALWDYHSRTSRKGQFYENNEFLTSKDWDGMVIYYKTFLTPTGFSDVGSGSYAVHALMQEAEDARIPLTPQMTYTGDAGFPVNDLTFTVTSFRDPQSNNTFGAMQWRVAEVGEGHYEVDAVWESSVITSYNNVITVPAQPLEVGHTYRIRCRMQDTTDRWSHWSDPIQFTASRALGADILDFLRVTEVMYNPAPADTAAGELDVDKDEFEFIELKNIGDQALDLSDTTLADGVRFDFNTGAITTLAPGAFVLVVENEAAFLSRYGAGLTGLIAGEYNGKLSNSGENLRLEDVDNGVIVEFTYSDDIGWPALADGNGYSLVPLVFDDLDQPENSLNDPANWRASSTLHGSPGQDDL